MVPKLGASSFLAGSPLFAFVEGIQIEKNTTGGLIVAYIERETKTGLLTT